MFLLLKQSMLLHLNGMSNFSDLGLNPLKEKKLKKCIFNNIL